MKFWRKPKEPKGIHLRRPENAADRKRLLDELKALHNEDKLTFEEYSAKRHKVQHKMTQAEVKVVLQQVSIGVGILAAMGGAMATMAAASGQDAQNFSGRAGQSNNDNTNNDQNDQQGNENNDGNISTEQNAQGTTPYSVNNLQTGPTPRQYTTKTEQTREDELRQEAEEEENADFNDDLEDEDYCDDV